MKWSARIFFCIIIRMSGVPAKSLLKTGLLCAALLVTLAWPAHVAFSDKTMADLNCQESVLVSSSELNSDCGNPLLEFPANFVFVVPAFLPVPAATVVVPVLRSRAPPLT